MHFDPLPCLQLPSGGDSLPRGLSGRGGDENVDHLTEGSQNSVKRVSGKMFCSKMLQQEGCASALPGSEGVLKAR